MEYELQATSVWSFPDRGSWATNKGDYRGNWSPHVPKNLILKYTKEKDLVLDCFLGSGTTMIECKELNRNGIGIDINPKAISITKERLNYEVLNNSMQTIFLGDAKKMENVENESIDFICTHPPYSDIIHYSESLENDLSLLSYCDFLDKISDVAVECYRVLKPNHLCSFMIGDIRKNGNVLPLGFNTMQSFVTAGFSLKEIIIKEQHNCKSTIYWSKNDRAKTFYLLAHEYIFVLKKTQ
ncbi:MAG: DNA methyltransferase [Erysipelotrichaceae bacterium]|nr:DNA methyltransferase [Erysipelotrichaceae bacterium]